MPSCAGQSLLPVPGQLPTCLCRLHAHRIKSRLGGRLSRRAADLGALARERTTPRAIFVPGRIACGGNEQGGWCDRPFAIYVPRRKRWQSPAVRLAAGRSAPDDLREYAVPTASPGGLEEKMSAELLAKFKDSVLVYYAGNCREKLRAHLDRSRPTPDTLRRLLHGGFDKQYPDHLPPRPDFGTPEEFRAFFDRSHAWGT